mmetsp:Transcript_84360/g.149148  ORF Transcript_84360/g.149148 Transcript_84360/m.149148 type:complete len:216 (+) Transcript_84360:247-894(+)
MTSALQAQWAFPWPSSKKTSTRLQAAATTAPGARLGSPLMAEPRSYSESLEPLVPLRAKRRPPFQPMYTVPLPSTAALEKASGQHALLAEDPAAASESQEGVSKDQSSAPVEASSASTLSGIAAEVEFTAFRASAGKGLRGFGPRPMTTAHRSAPVGSAPSGKIVGTLFAGSCVKRLFHRSLPVNGSIARSSPSPQAVGSLPAGVHFSVAMFEVT